MKFTKMEGIGNDYIYIDAISQQVPTTKNWIQNISMPHYGIGSDGVILILESDIADFKMRIFNKDGSEAKMCGNGIRCFAKFCYDHQLTSKTTLLIETLSGIRKVSLQLDKNKVVGATVDMGEPKKLSDIKKLGTLSYQLISMGNPHAVVFVDDLNLDIETIGELISRDSKIEGGVNVEFVKVLNDHEIQMRVLERGSGETLACGTGACASVMHCIYQNLTSNEVLVHLLGGDLNILYSDNHVYMSGACKTVFEGVIYND